MYLVTGGAGFIGSNIVADLERRGMGPIAVCDRFGKDDRWRNLSGRAVEAVIDPSDLMDWLANNVILSGIIHMGAISSTSERDVDALLSANARLTSNLFVFAGLHAIPFIYASSASVYGASRRQTDADEHLDGMEPLSAYGWSKKVADQMVLARLRDFRRTKGGEPERWAGLRFFNVYGPGEAHKRGQQSYVTQCLLDPNGDKSVQRWKGSERFVRDWVWVGDCARVVCELLQSGKPFSGIHNIGTGRARSFDEVIGLCGVTAETFHMPVHMCGQYQEFTQAETLKFKRLMPHFKFASLEEGVELYRASSSDLKARFTSSTLMPAGKESTASDVLLGEDGTNPAPNV
jgi:ADP-L-glycero-D-manno-heptose 6-epimerase